jgi:hypothetical protein
LINEILHACVKKEERSLDKREGEEEKERNEENSS